MAQYGFSSHYLSCVEVLYLLHWIPLNESIQDPKQLFRRFQNGRLVSQTPETLEPVEHAYGYIPEVLSHHTFVIQTTALENEIAFQVGFASACSLSQDLILDGHVEGRQGQV